MFRWWSPAAGQTTHTCVRSDPIVEAKPLLGVRDVREGQEVRSGVLDEEAPNRLVHLQNRQREGEPLAVTSLATDLDDDLPVVNLHVADALDVADDPVEAGFELVGLVAVAIVAQLPIVPLGTPMDVLVGLFRKVDRFADRLLVGQGAHLRRGWGGVLVSTGNSRSSVHLLAPYEATLRGGLRGNDPIKFS